MSDPVRLPIAAYEVVRETWLTRKPAALSAFAAAVSTFLLALGSLIYLQDVFGAASWMSASSEQVFGHGQYWRLWTTTFAHADLGHFVANSFLFYILGYFLYGYFGWRFFPLAAFAWGGLINAFVLLTYDPQTSLVGASGVVYWMGGAWLILYFFLSRQKNFTQRWLRSLGVGILLFMPAEAVEPRVSYRAHLIGFLLGLLAGLLHYLWYRKRYQAAEVRERIVEVIDPGDELPPPEGIM